ncbi:hypothetical protein EJ02DRAFT_347163 [Clathrospora elynae]|uniref:Zn(2)-C6 fungal-type domain-containing protein n=1 Tax=Clathrospora elynae TaxID=706981 RepID=A0A6A5SM33_9PLEO|nr:hypothetical protein EJ02DRAFT_347163 [Clathrospora elynae]
MDPSERWQNIAPASEQSGSRRPPSDKRKRRQAIAVACIQCRVGKAKCDGTRPRCVRCNDNDITCQYDVAEGVSRAERMKMLKKDSLSGKVEELERIVFSLCSGTDFQAVSTLTRLRFGERLEDVAKSLPAIAPSSAPSEPPSLLTTEFTASSASGLSRESLSALDKKTGTPSVRHGSTVSLTSPIRQLPGWPTSHYTVSPPLPSSAKGKQPATVGELAGNAFLSILYDRDDYLLARGENEDGLVDDDFLDETIDPRLMQQASLSDHGLLPLGPSTDGLQSRKASPQIQQGTRSIHATHIMSRQQIVNTIRVHQNFALRNPVILNYTPMNPIGNLSFPTWSMMPVNTRPDPGSLRHAFLGVMQEATELITRGAPVELIIEKHPNIAALFDEEEFNKSGVLSKWAVGMVHSDQLKGNTFTCFASMYKFWYLMRWMIFPSAETYDAIPEWLRPTPNQLFMPHISILDFVVWPAFREFAVQIPTMQEKMEWLSDMSANIQCDWSFPTEESLRRDEETGLVDLCPVAMATMHDLSNWSVGPSFRGYVSNADSYVRIRTEAY